MGEFKGRVYSESWKLFGEVKTENVDLVRYPSVHQDSIWTPICILAAPLACWLPACLATP